MRIVKKGPDREKGGKHAAQQRRDPCKVVEIGKRVSEAQQKANGTRTKVQTDTRQRKVSCKRTGAHIQTASVTKKRKLVETKDKIVETKTIVVKRVRSKKQMR